MNRNFGRIFLRQSLRHQLRHPALSLLNILSVALGVAVFLAIQTANRSALASFSAGIDLVAGKAQLEVRGPLDETWLPRIRQTEGVAAATPLVQSILSLPDHPGEYLRLVGVDPFTNGPFETFRLVDEEGRFDLEAWLRSGDSIALTKEFAGRLGLAPGDALRVDAPTGIRELKLRFLLSEDSSLPVADPRFAAMDIGWVQELLTNSGTLSSVLILAEPGAEIADVRERLEALLPEAVEVTTPSARTSQTEAMLSSFQLNLTALSLVSMLVGVFFIYNTISTSVIRRTTDIAVLRAIGCTRNEVRWLFLLEAMGAGAIGSVVGVLLAIPLTTLLLGAVSETISSLYVLMSLEKVQVGIGEVGFSLALGIGSAAFAAWIPAAEAAAIDPARALHPGSAIDRFQRTPPKLALLGMAALAAAVASSWSALEGGPRLLGFLSAFLLVTGFSLLVPALAAWVCARLLEAIPPGLALIRLGIQNLRRSLHRSAITVAALAAAVAMTVGIEVMINSFRTTVAVWLNDLLVADLYIGPAVNEVAGLVQFLPQEMEDWARAQPGVTAIATYRELVLPTDRGELVLGVSSGEARGRPPVIDPDPGAAYRAYGRPDHLFVSESLANKQGYRPGDQLMLPTPQGKIPFTVAGIYTDYLRDSGIAMMSRENFERRWQDMRFNSLAVKFAKNHDPRPFEQALRAKFASAGTLATYTNRSIKERAFGIFDQTFAVTYVLRSIAILVSVVGVVLSLTAFVAERRREIGTLRAIGASTGNIRGIFCAESAVIGLLAASVGTVCGIFLAMVLTWVINRVFFGWTIQLEYEFSTLIAALLWMPPAAALAALLPAARAVRIPPAAALRYE